MASPSVAEPGQACRFPRPAWPVPGRPGGWTAGRLRMTSFEHIFVSMSTRLDLSSKLPGGSDKNAPRDCDRRDTDCGLPRWRWIFMVAADRWLLAGTDQPRS